MCIQHKIIEQNNNYGCNVYSYNKIFDQQYFQSRPCVIPYCIDRVVYNTLYQNIHLLKSIL